MEQPTQPDSGAWRMQVILAFIVALGLTTFGIWFLPVDLWVKGYLMMGLYFTVSSSFALSKTLRDEHERGKLTSRLSEAQAEKLLREYAA